jgi:hypothetical protein
MNTLTTYLNYTLNAAKNPCFEASTFYNQAFGAVQYHLFQFPQDEYEVVKMWDEVYKPAFEAIIYGGE